MLVSTSIIFPSANSIEYLVSTVDGTMSLKGQILAEVRLLSTRFHVLAIIVSIALTSGPSEVLSVRESHNLRDSNSRKGIDQNTYHVNNETSNGNTKNYKILNIALKHENVAIAKILQRLVSRFALGDDSQIITEQLPGPDISYVVHKLSQAMHGPLKSDLKLAFRVLRYLKGALGMRVLFKASDSFELTAFVDSDWSKCIATRRSVTGFAVFLGSCLVSWKSKEQSVLASIRAV
ncbi:hypothetical protein Tco_0213309 [Tanacetum coccineum]